MLKNNAGYLTKSWSRRASCPGDSGKGPSHHGAWAYRSQRLRAAIVRARSSSKALWLALQVSARVATGARCCGGPSPNGAAEVAAARSVHAAGSPFLRTSTLNVPAATAASAHRRAHLWNSCLQRALQNFFAEPPRRSVSGATHHKQIVSPCIIRFSASSARIECPAAGMDREPDRLAVIARHGAATGSI
jgi:hypothetical protein